MFVNFIYPVEQVPSNAEAAHNLRPVESRSEWAERLQRISEALNRIGEQLELIAQELEKIHKALCEIEKKLNELKAKLGSSNKTIQKDLESHISASSPKTVEKEGMPSKTSTSKVLPSEIQSAIDQLCKSPKTFEELYQRGSIWNSIGITMLMNHCKEPPEVQCVSPSSQSWSSSGGFHSSSSSTTTGGGQSEILVLEHPLAIRKGFKLPSLTHPMWRFVIDPEGQRLISQASSNDSDERNNHSNNIQCNTQ